VAINSIRENTIVEDFALAVYTPSPIYSDCMMHLTLPTLLVFKLENIHEKQQYCEQEQLNTDSLKTMAEKCQCPSLALKEHGLAGHLTQTDMHPNTFKTK